MKKVLSQSGQVAKGSVEMFPIRGKMKVSGDGAKHPRKIGEGDVCRACRSEQMQWERRSLQKVLVSQLMSLGKS